MGNTTSKNGFGFKQKFVMNIMFFGTSLCLFGYYLTQNPLPSIYQQKISKEIQKGKEILVKMQTPENAAKLLYKNGLTKFSGEDFLGSIADLKKTIELTNRDNPENSLLLVKSHLQIGRAYLSIDKHKEALERFDEALELCKGFEFKTNEEKMIFADLLHYTGVSYRLVGDFRLAHEYFDNAFQMKRELYSTQSVTFAETLREISLYYYKTHNYRQARDFIEKAVEILTKNSSEQIVKEKLRYVYCRDIIKLCNTEMFPSQKTQKLMQNMIELINSSQRSSVPNIEAYSMFLYSLGKFLVYRGQRKEGFEYLKNSLTVMSSKYDKRHPKIQELYYKVYRVYMFNFRSPSEIIQLMEN